MILLYLGIFEQQVVVKKLKNKKRCHKVATIITTMKFVGIPFGLLIFLIIMLSKGDFNNGVCNNWQ
jgi:hypothetical protein